MRTRTLVICIGLLVPLSLVACAGDSPKHVVKSYVDAQTKGDYDAAYLLLNTETREWLPRDVFAEMSAESTMSSKIRVVEETIDGNHAQVVVRMGDDYHVYELTRDGDDWRITVDPGIAEAMALFSKLILEPMLDSYDRTVDKSYELLDKGLDIGAEFLDRVADDLESQQP